MILIWIHYILIGITVRNISTKTQSVPLTCANVCRQNAFAGVFHFVVLGKIQNKKKTHFKIALASDTGEAYLHTDYVLLHVCVCLRVCNAVFFLCMFIQIKKPI